MTDKAPIKVRIENRGNSTVVFADGDIGHHEVIALRSAIQEAYDRKPERLVVDLSGVGYMASPGLATLVEALQIAKKRRVELVLCGMIDRVRAVFEIARLHTVFRIVDTLDAATA